MAAPTLRGGSPAGGDPTARRTPRRAYPRDERTDPRSTQVRAAFFAKGLPFVARELDVPGGANFEPAYVRLRLLGVGLRTPYDAPGWDGCKWDPFGVTTLVDREKRVVVVNGAGRESDTPNFKGSFLGSGSSSMRPTPPRRFRSFRAFRSATNSARFASTSSVRASASSAASSGAAMLS